MGVVSESGFLQQFFETIINLAPMGVLYILGIQYITWSDLSKSVMFKANFLQ